MFPIDWTKITRAEQLRHGDFAYLLDYERELVLVGTINDIKVAIRLGADVSKCTTLTVEELSGPAFVIGNIRFEADLSSLEKLETMDERYEALVVSGKDILLVARPPSKVGYITPKVAELAEGNPSSLAFAYRNWRIVKDHGDQVVELYKKA